MAWHGMVRPGAHRFLRDLPESCARGGAKWLKILTTEPRGRNGRSYFLKWLFLKTQVVFFWTTWLKKGAYDVFHALFFWPVGKENALYTVVTY